MTRIYTTIQIPRSIETVFMYVTTPGNWPQWHPSSLGVSGATNHSLEVGEQVIEEFYVARRRGQVTWTVRERVAPRRWVIEGKVANGSGDGIITYALNSQGDQTHFEREFVYTFSNPLLAVLDWLLLRRRVEAESRQALQQLKVVLTQQQVSLEENVTDHSSNPPNSR